MTTLALSVLIVVITLQAAAAIWYLAAVAGVRPLKAKPAVLVVLRTGETLRGVLTARRASYLELARVEVLNGDRAHSTVDGTVQIDRDNVTWLQVL